MTHRRKSRIPTRKLDGASQFPRQQDNGNILIVVSFVGLFAMALSGGLITHFAVSEARGVADSLAKLRVYWAMVGHVDYALSRMRRENPTGAGWTNDLGENNIQGVLLGYLDELDYGPNRNCRGTTVTSTENSRCSIWLYDEVSNDYVFHFKWTVFDPANNDPPEGDTTDGRVGIRIDYVLEGAKDNTVGNPTSSIASLNNLSNRVLELEYIVCFVNADSRPFGPLGNCSPLDADTSGASRVVRGRRCIYDDDGSPGTFTGSSGSKTDNTETDTCI